MRRVASMCAMALAGCASSTPPPTTSPQPKPTTTTATAGTTTGAPLPDLLLPSEPTGGGSGSAVALPNPKPPPKDEQPGCATDQDCWSITCCPATDPEQCVHHSLAQKCAVIDMTCPKLETHLDCVCEKGVCTGRAP